MGTIVFKQYEPLPNQYLMLTINQKPIAKKNKYRIARGYIYKDPEVVKYEKCIQKSYRANCPKCVAQFMGEISVKAQVFFKEKRGDLDNAITTIFDALQGLVYKNDNQIRRIHAEKLFDKTRPRIELEFSSYPG